MAAHLLEADQISKYYGNVVALGDRFLILNRGQSLGTFEKSQIDRDELVRLMAGGRELAELEHELEAIRVEV